MSRADDSYGTGYVLTAIARSAEGDYRWSRRPGPHRGGALRTPDPAVLDAVRTAARGRVELTLPERADATGATYRAGQSRSIAAMLLGPGTGESDADIARITADTLAETGAALARLHAVPLPGADLPSPDGLLRLLSWLRDGLGPGAAPDLHRRAAEMLGRDRMATVAAWCVPPAEAPHVLLHGGPSLGILLPLTPGTHGGLLTGENLAAGPPESDMGWIIGELVELRASVHRFGSRRDLDFDLFIGRVLEGYTTAPDTSAPDTAAPDLTALDTATPDTAALDLTAVGRTAALRFLTHLHDFAAYLKWHDVLVEYLRLVADVIDAAGAGQLLPSPSQAARS
ncbi:hypothetical protein ACSDR0_12945 [Streptosporangium sp. G11]|uniref:hypothetical protein n=1 Tax=Streptosporangium sp. G11 TaxID=3436926 RepID=UPI003EBB4ECB